MSVLFAFFPRCVTINAIGLLKVRYHLQATATIVFSIKFSEVAFFFLSEIRDSFFPPILIYYFLKSGWTLFLCKKYNKIIHFIILLIRHN